MTTTTATREDVVGRLFCELIGFSRALRSRAVDWGYADATLTRADVHALGVLATQHGAIRPSRLAADLHVDPSAVSRQLVVLAELGLVSRDADPADRRAELVTLTPAGHERLAELRAAMRAAFGERLADWDERDLDHAATLLGRMARNLHEPLSTTKERA